MAILSFNQIGITGVAAAVPERRIDHAEFEGFFTPREIQSAIDQTGILERRVCDANTCASDLCHAAAESLLNEMRIDRHEIDVLIFVSQTPDYRMPATGIILQDRLGLDQTTAAFDINMGSSGYVYGLALAFSFAQQESIRKVLLLDGETRTKVYSFQDKQAGLLFGDGGSATVIERVPHDDLTFFSLNSDGAGSRIVWIKGGGYRHPSSAETLREKQYEDGTIRSDEKGVIDLSAYFDAARRRIPIDMKRLFEFTRENPEVIDFFVLHQASQSVNAQIAQSLKIPPTKVPYSLQKFGNTGSASIPLTMVSEIRGSLRGAKNRMVLSGLGAGLSWASAITSIDRCVVPKLVEV